VLWDILPIKAHFDVIICDAMDFARPKKFRTRSKPPATCIQRPTTKKTSFMKMSCFRWFAIIGRDVNGSGN